MVHNSNPFLTVEVSFGPLSEHFLSVIISYWVIRLLEADLQNTPLYLLSYLVIELFGDSDTRLIISAPSNLFFPGYLVIGLFGDADITVIGH